MNILFDQVYKFIFSKEHLMELMGAGEDWHRRQYMNLIKESLPFFKGDLGKCTQFLDKPPYHPLSSHVAILPRLCWSHLKYIFFFQSLM